MNQSEITAFGGATYIEGQGNQSSEIPMELDEYLLAVMGPKQMDDHVVLVMVTIFYLLIFVSGVIGNLSVCVVIVRSSQLHSAMNYYLVSLAVADLTIIVLGRLAVNLQSINSGNSKHFSTLILLSERKETNN